MEALLPLFDSPTTLHHAVNPTEEYGPRDPRDLVQSEALGAIDSRYDAGVESMVVQLPTGVGKTVLARKAIEHWGPRLGRPSLFVAPRRKLVQQSTHSFRKAGLSVAVEMAEIRARQAMARSGRVDVVVASAHSLRDDRLMMEWGADDFGLVILDECHRSASEMFQAIIDRFWGRSLMVGLSATPYRSDGLPLFPEPFAEKCYELSQRRAVKLGCILPIRAFNGEASIDLKGLGIHRSQAGKLPKEFMDQQVAAASADLAPAIRDAVRSMGLSTGIVFCPDVASVLKLTEDLRRCGMTAEGIHGNGKKHKMSQGRQKALLEAHENGDFEVLVSADLLAEGYDNPRLEYGVLARPKPSVGLFWQMVGRVLRIHPSLDVAHIIGFDFETDAGTESTLDGFFAELPEAMGIRDRVAGEGRGMRGEAYDPNDLIRDAEEIQDALRRQEEAWEFHAEKVEGKGQMAPGERLFRELKHHGLGPEDAGSFLRDCASGAVPCGVAVAASLLHHGFTAEQVRAMPEHKARAEAEHWSEREALGLASRKQYRMVVGALRVDPADAELMTATEAQARIGRFYANRNRRVRR